MMRATELTRALIAPSGYSSDDGLRGQLRERLASGIGPMVERLAQGDHVVVSLPLLRQARNRPDSLGLPEEAFVWKPVFVRRSLGLAIVNACSAGRFRTPMEAVGPVSTEAVAEWERTGWRTFHWEPWLAGLAAGARASVLAEAVGWATSLWSSFDWNAFPQRPQVGGVDDQWICPAGRTVRLKGRSELRVPLAAGRSLARGPDRANPPAALVSISRGCPGDCWSDELGFLALVAGLRSPSRPVPARVVGLWPDSGIHATVEIDNEVLMASVERVVATMDALVDARLSVAGRR
jgi:hypothetical protein